jgi:hypothetical protein
MPFLLFAFGAPQLAARTAPTEGQTVVVTFLMGQVTNIEPSMGS